MAKATGSKEYSSREKLPLMQSGIDTRSGSGSVLGSGSDVTPRIARSWDNNDQVGDRHKLCDHSNAQAAVATLVLFIKAKRRFSVQYNICAR